MAGGTLADIDRVTPVDKGFLRGDNEILGPEVQPGKISLTFHNGRSYAVPVHENLMAYHKPPTMAKFIEGPLLRDVPLYPEAVLDTANKIVEKEVARHG